MKEIKLTEKNEGKLVEIINEVEGRARIRTLTVREVNESLEYLFKKLGISKKALEGTIVFVDPNAQNFPNTYNGIPQSTGFKAEYTKNSWRILEVHRGRCETKKYTVTLSESAKQALIDKYTRF